MNPTTQTPSGSIEPRLDIVVASKNRRADVERCIDSFRAQPTRPARIIVVDQSAQPYDLRAASDLVHVYDPSLGGLPAARNRGVREARAEFVCFVDDDIEAVGDVIPTIVATFDRHLDCIGVQAPFRQPPATDLTMIADESLFKRIFSHGFFEEQPVRGPAGCRVRTLHGCAMAFRRALFEAELFDEQLAGYAAGEDWDFAKRAQLHGSLWASEGVRLFHHRVVTNRHKLDVSLRLRYSNFVYFFFKMKAVRRPADWFWFAWWFVGEMSNAVLQGVNPLSVLKRFER